jgi:hypothetical protein
MIGPLGAQPIARRRRRAEALAIAALRRHSQALITRQPLDLLAIHQVALAAQHGVRPPVAPPGVALSEAP